MRPIVWNPPIELDKTITQAKNHIQDARMIEAQDVEEASDGSPKLRKGVAKDRRISIEDEDMRHGRKAGAKNLMVINVMFSKI